MAVRRQLSCPPEAVFEVLADGWLYPTWVVGAARMRAVDEGWPAVGTRLHHSAGVWPALIDDNTEVLQYEHNERMVLEARGWPAGKATVEITVVPTPTGCEVAIAEDITDGPAVLVPKPLRRVGMAWRNIETLRRLAFLAEGRATAGGNAASPM
jgi:hypothetical protein